MTSQARWYDLKKATPIFDPSQKDQWPTLAESFEEALSNLQKEPDLDCRLVRCEDDTLAEFLLEEKVLLRTNAGLQPGKLVGTFSVRRA